MPSAGEVERMGVERDAVGVFATGSRAAMAYEALRFDIRGRLAVHARLRPAAVLAGP